MSQSEPLRISVSALDSFDYFMSEDGYLELPRYIKQLKNEDPPGKAAQAGTEMHERIQAGDTEWFMEGEKWQIEKEVNLDPIVAPETKLEEIYGLGGGEVITLVGKIDGFCGLTMIDYKFTGKADYEKYAASWQWRAYLMMMPKYHTLRYEVFQVSNLDGKYRGGPKFRDHYTFDMHPYPEMQFEVMAKLDAYVQFLRDLERAGLVTIGPTQYRGWGVLSSKEEEVYLHEACKPDFEGQMRERMDAAYTQLQEATS